MSAFTAFALGFVIGAACVIGWGLTLRASGRRISQ